MTRRPYWEAVQATRSLGYFGTRMLALGVLLGWLLFGAIFAGFGLSIGVAAPLGGIAFGVLALAVVPWFGFIAFVGGLTIITLASLVAIPAIDSATGLNGWIVFLCIVVFWTAVTILVVRTVRGLRTVAGTSTRRKLAEKLGGQYLPEATVPVPGPLSSQLFKSVPNGATETTGQDVVFATMNGFQGAVFERIRANATASEPRQTVWLVRVPMRAPFTRSQVVDALRQSTDPQPHTRSVPFASALLTVNGQLNGDLIQLLPGWWWIEGEYLCTATEGTTGRGADPQTVETTLHGLTLFAARINWPALNGFSSS